MAPNLYQVVTDPITIANLERQLDQWVSKIPFSPIKSFSRGVNRRVVLEYACFRATVKSQIETRWFESHEQPYRGEALPINPKSKNQFDIWAIHFNVAADFVEHKRSQILSDTKEAGICDSCRGKGDVDCGSCRGCGKVQCGSCRGSGHEKKERTIPYVAVCNNCHGSGVSAGRNRCLTCRGGGSENKTRREEYFSPCSRCGTTGQVTCSGCSGRGLVRCDRCDGYGKVLRYISAEQEEKPSTTSAMYIATQLPKFKKKLSPVSGVSSINGPNIFEQDELNRIKKFDFQGAPAEVVLLPLIDTCRSGHVGQVVRQKVEIKNSSVFEYQYNANGNSYAIYINLTTGVIEDVNGPIQKLINDSNAEASRLFKRGQLGEAYLVNMRCLCMDEASDDEKALRSSILNRLSFHYCCTGVFASIVFSCAFSVIKYHHDGGKNTSSSWSTAILSVVFSFLVIISLARYQAILVQPRFAYSFSILIGYIYSCLFDMLEVQLYFETDAHVGRVIMFLFIIAITLTVMGFRLQDRKVFTSIESSQWMKTGDVQKIENYIKSLKPNQIPQKPLIGLSVICVIATVIIVYLKFNSQ